MKWLPKISQLICESECLTWACLIPKPLLFFHLPKGSHLQPRLVLEVSFCPSQPRFQK